jgi:two-component system, sensor histidine kinase and response regulator
LDKLGYRVDAVDNGLEALAAVERTPYRLILMDIQMPEMDGLEATRRIRAAEEAGALPSRGGRLPIVAMTAHALDSDRLRCLEAGMDAVITKPVKRNALGEALEQILSRMPEGSDCGT